MENSMKLRGLAATLVGDIVKKQVKKKTNADMDLKINEAAIGLTGTKVRVSANVELEMEIADIGRMFQKED